MPAATGHRTLVGGWHLRIAPVQWGGLLMGAALMTFMTVVNRRA